MVRLVSKTGQEMNTEEVQMNGGRRNIIQETTILTTLKIVPVSSLLLRPNRGLLGTRSSNPPRATKEEFEGFFPPEAFHDFWGGFSCFGGSSFSSSLKQLPLDPFIMGFFPLQCLQAAQRPRIEEAAEKKRWKKTLRGNIALACLVPKRHLRRTGTGGCKEFKKSQV